MAIDTGLLVACGDMNAVGGIRQILLTDLSNVATALPVSPGANHTLTSFIGTNPWARFEFKNETASLTITGAKEGGSTSYECAVSFYIPNCDGARFLELTKLESACPVALVEFNSGKKMVVGWSYKYENLATGSTPWTRNQTYANLTSIEGGSGAAYADDNGVTVTLTARQFELPLEYTGDITVVAGDLTATTD
tara:strand:+ start:1008 stop:1589 length:582 start_codon:yes stop_codon:yes gene_type:complete